MRSGNYDIELAPPGWPGKPYRVKYAYSHYVAYWKAHGVVPSPTEMIHHKDENKRNNDPDNLVLMLRVEHARMHALERAARQALLSPTPHGITRYTHHKCRCEVCVTANREYNRRYAPLKRAQNAMKRRAAGVPERVISEHGVARYGRHSCRCEICTSAHSAYYKQRRHDVAEAKLLRLCDA